MHPPAREATLVLCTPDGRLLGALPPVPVAVPWWPEAWPVVAAARAAHGLDVTVLRLLRADPSLGAGGPVTYLAEVARAPRAPLRPLPAHLPADPLAEQPLRQPWARPGGPGADLAWARERLAGAGVRPTGAPRQVKTWNLSSIWTLPTSAGRVWLKHVPSFLAHEGALLRRLDPAAVPRPLAVDGGRALLADVPGEDLWEAPPAVQERMVQLLVRLQAAWAGRVDELLALGLPDWRGPALSAAGEDVAARTGDQLDPRARAAVRRLLDGLPRRLSALDACGLPEALVHGDAHRGNLRGGGARLTLLDWGDSGAGHPLLDQAAFLDRLPAGDRAGAAAAWARAWQEAVPGSEPARAAQLLAPLAALRQAVVYRRFLDGIEPDERVYHAGDPAAWLRRAAALAPG